MIKKSHSRRKNQKAGARVADSDREQVRVHDGKKEKNEMMNPIADDMIGRTTILEFLEYCKLPRTREEMQKFCGLGARRSFRERYLNPLLKQGLLKMTIPDKPRSKNQRYYSEF